MELDSVLPGITSWLSKKGEHHLVHYRARTRVPDLPVIQPMRFPFHVLMDQEPGADASDIWATQAYYGHASLAGGRGDRRYGILTVH